MASTKAVRAAELSASPAGPPTPAATCRAAPTDCCTTVAISAGTGKPRKASPSDEA